MEDLFPIPNLPKYLISRCGNVFSEITGIYLNPNFRGKYLAVSVRYGDSRKTIAIHRMVAETFIPNPDKKEQVNHINGVRTDNRVENLEWCTVQENYDHSIKLKLRSKRVIPVLDTKTGVLYSSMRKACEHLGITPSSLYKKLNGKLKNNTSLIFSPQK